MTVSLTQVHQEVSHILKQTNQIALKYFSGKIKPEFKSDSLACLDIVTQADKEIEALLKKTLKQKFPDIGFIGEETSLNTIKDYNWIVDPIDGTMNFAYKIPLFGTSVALWQANQPLYGVISLPMQNQTVHAIKNQGVFLNNQKVKPKTKQSKANFVVFSSAGENKERLKLLDKLLSVIPLPRSYGCTVFQGIAAVLKHANAAIFIKNAIWDLGAIILIAQEAGLHCQFIPSWPDIHGSGIRQYKHTLVIGQKDLVNQLVPKLKQVL
jgi:myo-inositol-1(or 4)-monophosphatase